MRSPVLSGLWKVLAYTRAQSIQPDGNNAKRWREDRGLGLSGTARTRRSTSPRQTRRCGRLRLCIIQVECKLFLASRATSYSQLPLVHERPYRPPYNPALPIPLSRIGERRVWNQSPCVAVPRVADVQESVPALLGSPPSRAPVHYAHAWLVSAFAKMRVGPE